MVISISRRCDIPRFQFNWFMEQLDAGFVDVTNPFNAAQVRHVSLLPGEAEVFVFWTRDPRNILSNTEELEKRGFPFYVMITVMGYPPALEGGVPAAETVCAAMKELAEKIGTRRVIWRYDPVFLSSITGEDFHRRNFNALAKRLSGTVRRVIISLYDEYRGAKRRIGALEKAGILAPLPPDAPPVGERSMTRRLFADLAEIAAAAGMEIQSCSEAEDMSSFGIQSGACIDGKLIKDIWGIDISGKDKNQRPHCRCVPSVDIGRYGDCKAGCAYCYAQR